MDTKQTPIRRAIDIAGGSSALARACGVSPQAITKWIRNQAPAKRCAAIEAFTGISRYELRPDVFGSCQNNK